MVKHALRAAAAASVAAALAGCSTLGIDFTNEKVQYESSNSRAPLEIPPDLDQVYRNDRYNIPSRPQIVSANAEAAKAQMQAEARGEAPAQVLPETQMAKVVRDEDMPFLEDGTPLDIVLNPLGVPSRMNIGQVLEVHLGIAAKRLGMKVMTPAFDGAKESDITEMMTEAGLYREVLPSDSLTNKKFYEEIVDEETGERRYEQVSEDKLSNKAWVAEKIAEKKLKTVDGKRILYDGRTGEAFDNPVTVGIMYYLKLHHLVDDKIHARSVGPYSLVTQQPLGGKAQFGGQRFGEMEVWALEAYGAAYTLQEILTVKSDDVTGRVKTYEAIVKGQNIPTPGVPESFKVLVKELQSLALDIRVLDENGEEIELSQIGYFQGKDLQFFPILQKPVQVGFPPQFGIIFSQCDGDSRQILGPQRTELDGTLHDFDAVTDHLVRCITACTHGDLSPFCSCVVSFAVRPPVPPNG